MHVQFVAQPLFYKDRTLIAIDQTHVSVLAQIWFETDSVTGHISCGDRLFIALDRIL